MGPPVSMPGTGDFNGILCCDVAYLNGFNATSPQLAARSTKFSAAIQAEDRPSETLLLLSVDECFSQLGGQITS